MKKSCFCLRLKNQQKQSECQESIFTHLPYDSAAELFSKSLAKWKQMMVPNPTWVLLCLCHHHLSPSAPSASERKEYPHVPHRRNSNLLLWMGFFVAWGSRPKTKWKSAKLDSRVNWWLLLARIPGRDNQIEGPVKAHGSQFQSPDV